MNSLPSKTQRLAPSIFTESTNMLGKVKAPLRRSYQEPPTIHHYPDEKSELCPKIKNSYGAAACDADTADLQDFIYGSDFEDRTLSRWLTWMQGSLGRFNPTDVLRRSVYDPADPKLTTTQSFWLLSALGIPTGFITGVWKLIIEALMKFLWEKLPYWLVDMGVLTESTCWLYAIVTPFVIGCAGTYLTNKRNDIHDQNSFLDQVRCKGRMEYKPLLPTMAITTVALASGLSLGPELLLIVSFGMMASMLAVLLCLDKHDSRKTVLTVTGAAISAFFGLPLGGAVFVLELPHRSGLEYFEFLVPAVMSSGFACVCHSVVTGEEQIAGKFNFPELPLDLPFSVLIRYLPYALLGTFLGIAYLKGLQAVKTFESDMLKLFPIVNGGENISLAETFPLTGNFVSCRSWKRGILEKIARSISGDKAIQTAIVGGLKCLLHGFFASYTLRVFPLEKPSYRAPLTTGKVICNSSRSEVFSSHRTPRS
jgi:hypothetical protein